MICVFVRVWIVAPSIDHIASGNTIRECPAWFTKEWSSSHRERYTQYPDNDDDTIRIRLETQLAKLNEKSHTEETDLLRFRSLSGSRCFIGWTQQKKMRIAGRESVADDDDEKVMVQCSKEKLNA